MFNLIWGIIIGFGLAMIIGGIASYINRHTHQFVAKSVCHMRHVSTYEGKKTGESDITEVLYTCKCGVAKTQEFSGTWQLEDFLVVAESKSDRELQQLRKIAGVSDEQQ